MGHLEHISGPQDLRGLDDRALDELASEIRDELIRTCAPRGGHLGPNLGVVELTMAIHRVFESPRDRVVFDTGHQAYVHKMLTGRAGQVRHAAQRGRSVRLPQPVRVRPRHRGELPRLDLAVLRRRAGQGLRDPRRGPARRRRHRRRRADRRDGLGGAEQHRRGREGSDRRLVIVVNDNGRSYMPTVGGLANHLTALRTSPRYEQILDMVKRRLNGVRGVGPAVYDALHAMKKGMKDALAPAGTLRGPRPEVRRSDRRPRPHTRSSRRSARPSGSADR